MRWSWSACAAGRFSSVGAAPPARKPAVHLLQCGPLLEKLRTAQVVAFATPIYYYELCGQLKTFLDRTEPLYGRENAFRQVYLLSAAAETEDFVPKRAESGIQGWIDCYENLELAGTVFAGGVQGPGEMAGHPALEQARAMGAAIR